MLRRGGFMAANFPAGALREGPRRAPDKGLTPGLFLIN